MLSENDVNDIKSGSKTLWIFGHVDYIDTFKIRHRAGFARVYTSALDGGSRNNLSYAVEGSNRYNYDDLRKEGDGKDWT
jgi:hypothetical protein